MKTLNELGVEFRADKSSLWHKYLDFYEAYFKEKNFNPKKVLEVGVKDGNSIRMWKEYFNEAKIYGIDINSMPKISGVNLYQFDATSKNSFEAAFNGVKFDLIIDDGSHMSKDVIKTFEIAKNYLNEGGIYIYEDCHASFLKEYTSNANESAYKYFVSRYKTNIFQRQMGELDSMTMIIEC